MNVTIVLPHSLRPAVDGRRRLELGVPLTADLGDVLQTLFTLYPKLKAFVPSDKRGIRQELNVFLSEQGTRDLADRRKGMREGQKVYVFASSPAAG